MSLTTAPGGTPVDTAPRARTRDPRRHGSGGWLALGLVSAAALLMLVPLAIMLLNAFKPPGQYSTEGPLSWPTEFYTDGLRAYWTRVDFPLKLWNSTLIAGSVAVFAVAVSLLNAYALGIGRVRGRLTIVGLFLLANMLPQESLVYPLYYLAKEVGLYNTRLAVIIIFTVIQSAFGTYLLASVLGTFPRSLLEAAALDGAGSWTILRRVVLPNVRPTLAVLLVFFFVWTWNEFLIPLVMLIDNQTQTIPVALASLQGDRLMDAPTTNAGALVSLVPAIVFFLIFQRTLSRGITVGAEK
ncbi:MULTISPECIES: carbohydrate ABC transporter permease [Micromonospora]|uniref:Raffinose/stachyose/melibiose transport system permease protein n=1 Tax=Micromonospora yangpuensis TaxID=683228 RepID=A0A1C6UXI8_9ACTN|nr:carbohydrate ABC transporter permease [Micromonospora yangpuensis]GGL94549.1 ABC transporter permease [Micromonospora yangpuensis]SCL58731.1 raffinose/stachyose/melibiose transport system permease protein [Micromonospora yangpuensis]